MKAATRPTTADMQPPRMIFGNAVVAGFKVLKSLFLMIMTCIGSDNLNLH